MGAASSDFFHIQMSHLSDNQEDMNEELHVREHYPIDVNNIE